MNREQAYEQNKPGESQFSLIQQGKKNKYLDTVSNSLWTKIFQFSLVLTSMLFSCPPGTLNVTNQVGTPFLVSRDCYS